MIDQQAATLQQNKAKAAAYVRIPAHTANLPASHRHLSQPASRPAKFKKLNVVGGFHQDSETTLPKIKLKEKGTKYSKNDKITYIKPVTQASTGKKPDNLMNLGSAKEREYIYPYLKDNSLYSHHVNKNNTFERRKKSNLSDYQMSESVRQPIPGQIDIKMHDFSTAHQFHKAPDILSRYNAQRSSNEDFRVRDKLQTNQLILTTRRKQKETMKAKKSKKMGYINMSATEQDEIKKFSAMGKKAFQTEQVEGEKQVRTALGVQSAYESNPEQSSDAYDFSQNYNNITIKPGTQQNENNGITIPGTLYPVSQRPTHRIKLKEKRESSATLKTNPFKSSSPQKLGENPYYERQVTNLQGQQHYENYYKPSGNDKTSEYIKNIRKIIGGESKEKGKDDVFGTYMDSIISENHTFVDSSATRPPRKLSKLNVDNLTVNDVANIVSHNKLSLNHQRSQISSMMSENDQTMTMDQLDSKQSKQQVHLNKKLINVLKNANNNLQQFNDLMKQSPTRDKKEVVVEIEKNIRKVLSKKNLKDSLSNRSGNTRSLENFNSRFTGSVGLKKQDTLLSLRSKKSLMSPSIISSKFQSRRGTNGEENTIDVKDQKFSLKYKQNAFIRKITKELKNDLITQKVVQNEAQSRQKFAIINKESIQYLTQKDIQHLTNEKKRRNDPIMESQDGDGSIEADRTSQITDTAFARDDQNNTSQLSLKQQKESQKFIGLLAKQQKSTSKLEKLTQQFIRESQNMVTGREQLNFGSSISPNTPLRFNAESPSITLKASASKNATASRNVYRKLDYDEGPINTNSTNRKSKDTTDVQDLKHHTFQAFNQHNEYDTARNPQQFDQQTHNFGTNGNDIKRNNLNVNQFNNGVYSIESTLHQHGIVQDHLHVGASKMIQQRPNTNAFQDDTFYNPKYESTGRSDSLMSGNQQRSIQLGDNAMAYKDQNFQNQHGDHQSDQPYQSTDPAQNILTRPSKENKHASLKRKANKNKKKDSPVQDKHHLIQQYLKPINDLGSKVQRQKDKTLENKMLKTRKTSAVKRLKLPNASKVMDGSLEMPSGKQEHMETTGDADSYGQPSGRTLEDVALKEQRRLQGITQQTTKTPQKPSELLEEEEAGQHTPLRNFKIDLKNLNKNSEKEYIQIQANDSKAALTPMDASAEQTQDDVAKTPNAETDVAQKGTPNPETPDPGDDKPADPAKQLSPDLSMQTLEKVDEKNSKKYRKYKQKGTPQIKGVHNIKEAKSKITKVMLKQSKGSSANLQDPSPRTIDQAPNAPTPQQNQVSSIEPKSFDPEGGVPSASNPVSILKSPPMYNTLTHFKTLKGGSMAAGSKENSKSPDGASLQYSKHEQFTRTARDHNVEFRLDKRRKTQEVSAHTFQNPYSNNYHNQTISEGLNEGISSGESVDNKYATSKLIQQLDKVGLATQRIGNSKYKTLQFSTGKRRKSKKSRFAGVDARESSSEMSGKASSIHKLGKTNEIIEDQFNRIKQKFQNINQIILNKKSGNRSSDKSQMKSEYDDKGQTFRRATMQGDIEQMLGSKRSIGDSADVGNMYSKLNKTQPSKSLQKSYEQAMVPYPQQKAPLSRLHESARNFPANDLSPLQRHIMEPSTPIIVEASQILEESQSQIKLRMPQRPAQSSSPLAKEAKDITVEQMDASLKRQSEKFETIINQEFKAQFEAVAKQNDN